MEQDLFYSLRFNLNENTRNFGSLFSSINFFADLFGRLDHLLLGALPLRLDFSRSLKDFGENSFLFIFRDHIIYPDQFPLGYRPDSAKVEEWMTKGREYFSAYLLGGDEPSAEDLKNKLDELGKTLDFDDLISYRKLIIKDLENIIQDLKNARNFLVSENGIILFE